MEQEIYDFLRAHLQKKAGAFVIVHEIYDNLPMTRCVLRHSIEDITEAIRHNRIWAELGTKCELKKVDRKYGPMTCFCRGDPSAEVFSNVEFDLVKDGHFIECPCCYEDFEDFE